jgi:transglutaminase-like putative cysteine protease
MDETVTLTPVTAPPASGSESIRTISCDLVFSVTTPAEIVLQIVAADTAGQVLDESLEVHTNDGVPIPPTVVRDPYGARLHILQGDVGRLSVAYRARIEATAMPRPLGPPPGDERSAEYERQIYLRPSRYCPSDHLIGFAVAQFGTGPNVAARVAGITNWIRQRIGYVPGSSTVHDSAEDTLLTGMGTCRDFAHLGIALCRATGIPARFVAVYAPGLSPMDFHAVFEAFENGRWYVYDGTGLAPRSSLVRIATGRDAADAAFAATVSGSADLESMEVSATVGTSLPRDQFSLLVQLP